MSDGSNSVQGGGGQSPIDQFNQDYENNMITQNQSSGGSTISSDPNDELAKIKQEIQELLYGSGRGYKPSIQAIMYVLFLFGQQGGVLVQEKADSLTALSQIQQFINSLNSAICGAGNSASGADDDVTNALNNISNSLSSVSGNTTLYDTLTGGISQIRATIADNGGMENIWSNFVSGGPSGLSAPSAMNAIMSNVGVLTQSSTSYSAQLNAEVSTKTKQYSAEQDLLGNVIKSTNQLMQQIISATQGQR